MSTETCRRQRGSQTMSSSSIEPFDLSGECGSTALVTREQGAALLVRAAKRLEVGERLEVSVDGAEALSPSFADEFFGGLSESLGREEFGRRVRIRCSSQTWKILIRKVLAHRGQHPKTARSVA